MLNTYMVMVLSFEKALQDRKPRKTPISWEDLIGNILDQYLQYVNSLAHAVQKDAIQNSWDARTDPESWRMEFKLVRDSLDKEMLIMEDHGTTGLTGRILPEEEYDKDLPEEEKWGRFQGLAFRRENPKALGARGQGKFVFVGSSETGTIVYDTLRGDGVYRLGVRRLGNLWECEGQEAVELLKLYSEDLKPLAEIGTRVIIDNPIPQIRRAFQQKQFLRYIQTTWWALIRDHKISIYLEAEGKRWKATYPSDLRFPEQDSKDIKVWIKEWIKLREPKRKKLSGLHIKKLHICWSKTPLQEDIQGIAVLRGGMVIERIPIADMILVGETKLTEHIYGYIEGDMGVQHKLKLIEDPTHYRFRRRGGWGRKNIYGQIREYISGQLQVFADKKLGLKRGVRESEDVTAIKTFNRIMKAMKISIFAPILLSTSEAGGAPSTKDFSIKFPPPDFPNPERKVEFKENISSIRFQIQNKTKAPADVQVKIYTEQDWILRDTIIDEAYPYVKPDYDVLGGPFTLEIKSHKYTQGRCHLRARLICLTHPKYEKGQNLDKRAHIFWIAQEPPPRGKGPFREIERRRELIDKIDERSIKIDSKVIPHPDSGYILLVNLGHPLYKERCPTKTDEQDYIIELMAQQLPHILIANDHDFFKGVEDPDEIIRRSSLLHSEIMNKYYA